MAASGGADESSLWRIAYEVFERAMELPPGERESFVAQQSAAGASLQAIVLDLIANAEAEEEALDEGFEELQSPSSRTGMRFGRYEVRHKLGRGATGQVYAAYDAELDRQVALKFLSSASSSSGGSAASAADRLILEAKAASALSHPHIVTVYEVVREGGDLALAMELVDGESMRQYCSQPQPAERIVGWARQIAQALDATHSHGIVHRDIKPENLMVRRDGFVKVLDFGLARRRRPGALSSASKSTAGDGALAGTLRYMSPEQTRGSVPGPGGDIFSLGIVLAELLAGRHPFDAASPIDTAYAIAHSEPDFPLQGALPDLIRQMLAKDPAARPVAAEVERRLATMPHLVEDPTKPRSSRRFALAVAALAAVVTVAFVAYLLYPKLSSKSRQVVRFQIAPPEGSMFRLRRGGLLALSPDDRSVVLEVVVPGRPERLVLRRLDEGSYRELPGTELGSSPFFSPDGQEIGYYHPTGLFVYSLTTGKSRKVVPLEAKSDAQRAIWPVADTIYYLISGSPEAGLYSVHSDGSGRRLLQSPQSSPGEPLTLFPRGLDGNRLLVGAVRGDRRLAALDLDTYALRPLIDQGMGGTLLPSGHLVFYREGNLVATRVDRDLQADARAPVPVVRDVEDSGWSGGYYDITPSGTLAYLPAAGPPPRQLVWVDLHGRETPLPMPPAHYEPMSISPDGSQAAIARYESDQRWTLFLHDFKKGSWTVLGEGSGRRPNAAWSPDGRYVAFPSLHDGTHHLFNVYIRDLQAPEGSDSIRRLAPEQKFGQIPEGWAIRDDLLLYGQGTHPQTLGDIYAVRLSDPSHPRLAAGGPGFQSQPAVSPSGRWIAYRECQDSCFVMVRPFLRDGEPVTVGEKGAYGPQWSPAGDTLYIVQHREVQAVPFSDVSGKPVGPSKALFAAPYHFNTDHWGRSFALSPDGKRFLFAKPVEKNPRQPQLQVILNWASELNRLVP
jgi:hypothetical protein